MIGVGVGVPSPPLPCLESLEARRAVAVAAAARGLRERAQLRLVVLKKSTERKPMLRQSSPPCWPLTFMPRPKNQYHAAAVAISA